MAPRWSVAGIVGFFEFGCNKLNCSRAERHGLSRCLRAGLVWAYHESAVHCSAQYFTHRAPRAAFTSWPPYPSRVASGFFARTLAAAYGPIEFVLAHCNRIVRLGRMM
jgi:hypothetical protein